MGAPVPSDVSEVAVVEGTPQVPGCLLGVVGDQLMTEPIHEKYDEARRRLEAQRPGVKS